jgi:UDP-N-acetyl-2-amino-2-deoxyglucuronate dehydrogenase
VGVRVGVVGAGIAGRLHALGYLSAGSRARLVAVADVDLERAREMRKRFGFEDAIGGHRELLARSDIDVVSVCTPAADHAQVVLDAVRASKHVLCEKPITITEADAQSIMTSASEQPDLCVSCVFQHRDDPAVRGARWLLGQGAIGAVSAVHLSARVRRDAAYYAGTRGQMRADGGGALMVQGIHVLDALTWLVGDVRSVSATMDTFVHSTDTEDTIAGWARLESGAIATIDCTTCAQRDEYRIDVLGATGSVHLGYRPGWARTWDLETRSCSRRSARALRRSAARRFPPEARMRAGHVAGLATARLARTDRTPHHLGHGPHVRRFLLAIENGEPAPVALSDAARSVETVLAFYRSAALGEVVQLRPRLRRAEP